jgi:hypothetical protein
MEAYDVVIIGAGYNGLSLCWLFIASKQGTVFCYWKGDPFPVVVAQQNNLYPKKHLVLNLILVQ